MAKRNSGGQRSERRRQQVTLLDLKELLFHLDGKTLNVEDATDEEFDRFIRQHITIGWSLEDRRDAINLALEQGKTLGIMSDVSEEKSLEKPVEKSSGTVIFSGSESAQEAQV